MKGIQDERLELQRLKNIRFVFIVQTIGILVILLLQLFTDGIRAVAMNPLWILLMIVGVILSYQNLMIADEIEDEETEPGPYYRVILWSLLFSVISALFTFFYPGDQGGNAIVVGLIVFACFFILFSIVYVLLKKRVGR